MQDISILADELKFFEVHQSDLFARAPRKFALIKGSQLYGCFDTQDNAYEEGARLFGNQPFLIKRILLEEPIESIPAYTLGLLHAGL
ncbi:MAG: hypothetical protein HYV26_04270 [Candidatus Hydrogenedentes bacterium]|nr:hypothetical protein [Candidatus Hydrogenedentota bacterium]MBI3118325.1 hypothetical protein [Candidatus Hydrogenedentota bacterium]